MQFLWQVCRSLSHVCARMVDSYYPTATNRGETVARKSLLPSVHVTGLILAGGAGRRVGERDKGLLTWRGESLVGHVHSRIKGQVDEVIISCNRNADEYGRWSTRVFKDGRADFQGPLAGVEAALPHFESEYLLVVPCDTPLLPPNLAEQLLAPLLADASLGISYARSGDRDHYLCAILRRTSLLSLSGYLDEGGRAVRHWYVTQSTRAVGFPGDDGAFLNLNELSE